MFAIAVLGFFLALWGLFLAVFAKDPTPIKVKFTIDAVLSIASKAGLAILGIGLLVRSRFVRILAGAGLAVSVVDSLYNILVVAELLTADKDPIGKAGFYFGASSIAVISILVYVGALVFLSFESIRAEFDLAPNSGHDREDPTADSSEHEAQADL